MAGDLKEFVASHISSEYKAIYSEKESDGGDRTINAGNTFVATRTGLLCTMHAQMVMQVLLKTDAFRYLLGKDDDDDLLEYITEFSIFQNESHVARNDSDRDMSAIHSQNITLSGLMTKALNEATDLLFDQYTPLEDVKQAIIAHYFDATAEEILAELDKQTRKIQLSMPAYFPSSVHFGPLFLHQSADFQQRYFENFPEKCWTRAFRHEDTADNQALTDAVSVLAKEAAGEFIKKAARMSAASGVGTVVAEATGKIPIKKMEGLLCQFVKNAMQQTTDGYTPDLKGKLAKNPSPFAHIADQVKLLSGVMHQLKPSTPEDRAYLMSNLISMNTSPDIVVPHQDAGKLNSDGFERESINFVIQRYITAAVKSSLDQVLGTLAHSTYRFSHPAQFQENIDELNERLLSIMLGYRYPYLTKDQPRSEIHLSLDMVIPFLYRNLDQLTDGSWKVDEAGADEAERKMKRVSLSKDGEPGQKEPEVEIKGTSLETDIWRSVLFQAICENIQDAGVMKAKIIQWHEKWRKADKHRNKEYGRDLVQEVLEFLMEHTYRKISKRGEIEDEIREHQRRMTDWSKLQGYFDSFSSFLMQHGSKLCGVDELPDELKNLKPAPLTQIHSISSETIPVELVPCGRRRRRRP